MTKVQIYQENKVPKDLKSKEKGGVSSKYSSTVFDWLTKWELEGYFTPSTVEQWSIQTQVMTFMMKQKVQNYAV